MGDMYEETGLMVILSIGAIGLIGIFRFKSAVGITIEQVTTLLWAALISGIVVGGGIFTVLYKYDRWTQGLAAAVAGVTTPLIGSGIWLNTGLSIDLSMISGGLLAVIGLYLGRAALIVGVKWVVKKTMRSSSQRSLSSGSASARRKTTADHIIDHHQTEDSASPTKQQNRIEAMKREQERINRRNRKR
nr:hypothetical protein [Halocatena marina]